MPGTISLIGSGETASVGGQVFESIARRVKIPLSIGILETPAGFETNAPRVADRVTAYLKKRLNNFEPQIYQIAARKKGTSFSPDSAEIVAPLYESSLIFFGPGSPTYTVRQLKNSLAWNILQARHRLGAHLVLASAATIAISTLALPVYEIYKVGEDPHWKPGLGFLAPFYLDLIIIPHWNNREGGEDIDTSRCFMGRERFNQLLASLPPELTVVGIDEHTALTIDLEAGACQVTGAGSVHLLRNHQEENCKSGNQIDITALGDYRPLHAPETGLPPAVWQHALAIHNRMIAQPGSPDQKDVPPEIQALVDAREKARQAKDWPRADDLRRQIAEAGWRVTDSPNGPVLNYLPRCNA